ncbi:4-hydroxyphenylacetate 3-hydroxylase family protein [Bradyrhizobium sp. CB82]|uniref:4-hydroxyphenylacetate 3-hydroxylase family protein n=1 Tax=Bradyrhizobium sp. CB82 TaxID=3039159 RepID=UPI0024B0AD9E|nr:4-hydroxyphenylacetate 3-hydroxylase family protein [Bradyrhizobium sp. CB82]WFU43354.1 4-hydroxyphenylacetate 3-hydroxylase family protein [Bradyrhizobium sp. CB82]
MPNLAVQEPAETKAASALMTGASFLDSLRDDRSVFIYGEPVRDVTSHHAFRNAARSLAHLYDALHDPGTADVMLTTSPEGFRTHRYFTSSYSSDDLFKARDALAHWARMTFGFMGRTPDYKAGFIATLGSFSEFYNPFEGNALRWYRTAAEKALFFNHVIVNPPVDRNRPVHEAEDVFVHVVRERDDGIIVRGAKMVGTSAALSNATFVAQNSAVSFEKGKGEDFALVFVLPMNTPGLKVMCRRSYEDSTLSPFDNPLSARFDENDSVLIFDDVLVPWENLLIYRNIDKARSFYAASGFLNRYALQSTTKIAVKLDFMLGLLIAGLRSNGTYDFRGVQTKVAEVAGWRNLMWSLTTAMCAEPDQGPNGTVLPRLEVAATARYFGTYLNGKMKEIFETALGGAPIAMPSSAADLKSPLLRPLIDRFYRGSDSDAEHRIKLYKLVWDAIGSEFGGRHELYEYNYAGNNEQVRLDLLGHSAKQGIVEQSLAMVRRCMSDYDLSGWTNPVWTNG